MLTSPTSIPAAARRGQIIVLFALLLPVIMAIGSIVVSGRELVRPQAAPSDAGRCRSVRG